MSIGDDVRCVKSTIDSDEKMHIVNHWEYGSARAPNRSLGEDGWCGRTILVCVEMVPSHHIHEVM